MNEEELKIMAGVYAEMQVLYRWKARELLSYYYAIKHPGNEQRLPFNDIVKDVPRLLELLKDDEHQYKKIAASIKMPSEEINLNNYSKYVYGSNKEVIDKNEPDYLIILSNRCFNLSRLYKFVSNNMHLFTIDVLFDLDHANWLTANRIFRAMGFFEAKYQEQLKNLKGAYTVRENSLRNIHKLRELLMEHDSNRMQDRKYRRSFINRTALEFEVTGRTIENWLKQIEAEQIQ